MACVTRKPLLAVGLLSGVAVLAAAGFVWSGAYDIGADDQHIRPVHALMHGHAEGVTEDHHAVEARNPAGPAASNLVEHGHADGTVESHPAPPVQPATDKAGDGHDHDH